MSQEAESPLIGARMNMVLHAITDRVLAEVHRAGFADIRPAHLSVLRSLWPQGRRISELAGYAGITKASVVYLVDQLEGRRYVERVPDSSDGRATLVQLSERGWAVHQVARRAVQCVQDEWTRAVGKSEMEVFLSTLARLADLADSGATADRSNGQRKARLKGRRHESW
jgi:DNA-binding MarR family transcriptional regulator